MATNNKTASGVPKPLPTDEIDVVDIQGIADKVEETIQSIDLLKGAKIEYVYIPASEQLVRSIPNQTSVLIALSANNDDFAFVALLTRFGAADSGYVQTVIRDHSSINIGSNASRTSCFITPTYSARGMIITVNP